MSVKWMPLKIFNSNVMFESYDDNVHSLQEKSPKAKGMLKTNNLFIYLFLNEGKKPFHSFS